MLLSEMNKNLRSGVYEYDYEITKEDAKEAWIEWAQQLTSLCKKIGFIIECGPGTSLERTENWIYSNQSIHLHYYNNTDENFEHWDSSSYVNGIDTINNRFDFIIWVDKNKTLGLRFKFPVYSGNKHYIAPMVTPFPSVLDINQDYKMPFNLSDGNNSDDIWDKSGIINNFKIIISKNKKTIVIKGYKDYANDTSYYSNKCPIEIIIGTLVNDKHFIILSNDSDRDSDSQVYCYMYTSNISNRLYTFIEPKLLVNIPILSYDLKNTYTLNNFIFPEINSEAIEFYQVNSFKNNAIDWTNDTLQYSIPTFKVVDININNNVQSFVINNLKSRRNSGRTKLIFGLVFAIPI